MARMRPREVVASWVEAFNRADVEALTNFYQENAINHQVAEKPVEGRQAIRERLASEFAAAKMVCIVEHIFEDASGRFSNGATPRG
jgi:ketosteroid isomerase-like protein